MFEKKNTGTTEAAVRQALSTVIEPELHQDLITLDMIKDITISGSNVGFTVVLTTPACPLRGQIEAECVAAVMAVPGVEAVNVDFTSVVRTDSRIMNKLNIPVKNVIAVSSGKGGVGKSTLSVNLAVSLALEGAKVGIMDADVYGPNIPMMMGLSGPPSVRNGKMVPQTAYGVETISMGYLMPEGEAVVWRGPMLHGAIRQFLTDVAWGELDYLVVDLPPGTGDAQLTLAQSVPITGGLIITTPQQVSVSDARRGAAAFKKLDVPILGIVENMAGEIFGSGGGMEAAKLLGVDFIGRVSLDPNIRVGGDAGTPIVISHPESETAKAFRHIARITAALLSVQAQAPDPQLEII